MSMKRTNIFITEFQQKRFKALAKKKGVRASELIRKALDEWLEKYDTEKVK